MKKTRFQEYADPSEIIRLINKLNTPSQSVRIMNVCGSHEHTICRSGIRSLLPQNIELIPGPGCPVCVTPEEDIINAVEISNRNGMVLATYGDMVRVPTQAGSIREKAKNLKIISSCHEALTTAKDKPVLFLSIGFETTAAPAASLFRMGPPSQFYFLSSHKLTKAAMKALCEDEEVGVDAFIAPGHVSTITGSREWEELSQNYGIPVVIAGFGAEDILSSIALILFMLKTHNPKTENVYKGVVKKEGNIRAQKLMKEVFDITDTRWRGLGTIENSGLELKDSLSPHNARSSFQWERIDDEDGLCRCKDVIMGKAYPHQCPLFKKACTPHTPKGACMVSREGACNIWFRFGRW